MSQQSNKYKRDWRRKWRAENPFLAAYDNLRWNAKRRGHVFTLTFVGFLAIPRINEYVWLKGRRKQDLTIDRIKSELGYEDGNCQILTNEENNKKRWDEDRAIRERLLKPTVDAPF